MTWVLFALAAPFWWALSNLLDKFTLSRLARGVVDFIIFGTIGNALFFVALVAARGIERIPPALTFYAVAAGFLVNYAYLFYAKALEKADVSRVAPLFQTIPMFVLAIGYIFFGETLTGGQITGFLFVLAGGFFLSSRWNAVRHLRVGAGFWWMLASSAVIGVSTTFTNHVLGRASFWTTVTYDSLGFSLAAVSLLLRRAWREEVFAGFRTATFKKYFWFLLNDGIDLLGHLFYKSALLAAPAAALVAVILGIQPFYLLALGFVVTLAAPSFVREDVSRKALLQKFAGIAIIFFGVYLISLA